MADIDQILSGGAGASTRADFSGIADIPKYYWEAKDQRFKNDLRDSFKGGVPTLPDGSIDYGTMQRTLYQKGALEQGNSLAGVSAQAADTAALNRLDAPPPQGAPTVGPSTSRNSVTIDPSKRSDAPPLPQAAPRPQGQPAQQPTVMTIMAQHVPNDQLQAASESIARQLGVSPTDPLDLNDPRINNILRPAVAQIKRMGLGQVQPQTAAAGQPQTPSAPLQPTPVQESAQNDPMLKRLTLLAASQNKAVAAAAKVRLEDYLKNREATGPIKEYNKAVSQGFKGTFEDWQNRADENTAQRDVMTKSLIPRIDASQEKASAARDDINSIHAAREQLDANKGIFSGALADKRKAFAKVYSLLGGDSSKVANTESYEAAIGQRVASMVKAFGSGTAISDGDRKFAAAMAGGNITLDEASMRRILDIGEKAARGKIDQHNQLAEKIVGANEALKPARDTFLVTAPGAYKRPELSAISGASIGSKADYDKLPAGSTFTGPDGKQWRKP